MPSDPDRSSGGRSRDAVRRFARHLDHCSALLSQTCAILGSCAIVAIMLATVSDVSSRAVLGGSVAGAVESAELLLVAAAFLGIGYAQRRRVHVSVGIVMARMSPSPRHWLELLGYVLMILFFAWSFTVSLEAAWNAYVTGEYQFGLVNIPHWPARTAISLGLLSILVETLSEFMNSLLAWSDLERRASGGAA